MKEVISQNAQILKNWWLTWVCYLSLPILSQDKFQQEVRDDCHDMTQKSMSFNDFVIVTVKGNDYRTNFWFTTKSKAVDRLENADLGEKSRLLRLWEKK